jgi:carboxymethylenebutenolidase
MPGTWAETQSSGGAMRLYVATPSAAGPHPAVLVIQHAGGVDAFVQSMTDRIAEAGFVGCAPDLYHREAPGTGDDPMTRMGRLRDKTILEDVDAALTYLRSRDDVTASRIGVTGFCMGGRVAYLVAATHPDIAAAVVFYGGNIMVPWGEGKAPFELSSGINCPVLGLFGADDANPNQADVAKIDAELTRLGKPHEFHTYAGAGHAFMNEGRPSYREDAARDAWARCVGWFDRYLRT